MSSWLRTVWRKPPPEPPAAKPPDITLMEALKTLTRVRASALVITAECETTSKRLREMLGTGG